MAPGHCRTCSSKLIRVEQDDCEKILNAFLDQRQKQGRSIGPALFFLDQCGFCDVSMNLIARIMCQPMCEVFSYLNWDHMNRFLRDESKWSAIDRAFGGNQWRPVLDLEHRERAAFMLRTYKAALLTSGRSKHVWQFAMCDDDERLLYWLFFSTNSLRGLEEMKKAMWKVDPSGRFRLSDSDDPSQLHLFSGYTERVLADELGLQFGGKILTVGEVREFVLTETPAYLFKPSLSLMEREERLRPINAPSSRRKGTYPDESMRVQFSPRALA